MSEGDYTSVLADSCYDGICKLIVLNIVLYSVADILHFNKNTLSVALKYFNRIKKWLTRYILSRNLIVHLNRLHRRRQGRFIAVRCEEIERK